MALPSCNPDDPCMDETNPDCINYDPCKAEYPEKFEIEVSRGLHNSWETTKLRTFVAPTALIFNTNFNYDSVKWIFGQDPTVWDGRSLELRFRDLGPVLVKAIGYRPINTICFGATDDGIDTLTEAIDFRDEEQSPVFGVWRGVLEGETDSFNIEIERYYYVNVEGDSFFKGGRFTGLPKGTKTKEGDDNASVSWHYFLYGNYNSSDPNGLHTLIGDLKDENRIEVKYDMDNAWGDFKFFNGKRVK
jgi:hypothetical protein